MRAVQLYCRCCVKLEAVHDVKENQAQLLLLHPSCVCAGTLTVTRLLFVACLKVERYSRSRIRNPSAQVIKALASLPAAKGVSADCISTLMLLLFDSHKQEDAVNVNNLLPLVRLPNAKHINSQQLCELINAAGRCGMHDLVGTLCRCACCGCGSLS